MIESVYWKEELKTEMRTQYAASTSRGVGQYADAAPLSAI